MRRARLRTAVNLAAAQNRRRQTETPEATDQASSSSGTKSDLGAGDVVPVAAQATNDKRQLTSTHTASSPDAKGDNAGSLESTTCRESPFKGDDQPVNPDDNGLKPKKNKMSKVDEIDKVETMSANREEEINVSDVQSNLNGGEDEQTNDKSVPIATAEQIATKAALQEKAAPENENPSDITNKQMVSSVAVSSGPAPAPTLCPVGHPTGLRLGRSRFRPNLSLESTQRNRLRRISGSLGGSSDVLGSPFSPMGRPHRIRTISNSSASSDTDNTLSSSLLPVASPSVPALHRTLLSPISTDDKSLVGGITQSSTLVSGEERNTSELPYPLSPGKAVLMEQPSLARRQRRLTDSKETFCGPPQNKDGQIIPSQQLGPTVFDVRKKYHKKKFAKDVPERKNITMFDLIYYNPATGDRMSSGESTPSKAGSSLRSSRANSNADAVSNPGERRPSTQLREVCKRLEEEVSEDAGGNNLDIKSKEEDAMPVPQVKIGPDGALIIDEASTMIDTTAAKKAKEDLLKTPLVFETSNLATNYGSWGKKRKNVDWTERETVRFFKALSVFGTDFSMMENVFKRRSRHDLKMKFKKEERTNRPLVDKCLSQGLKFDASFFDHESEQEEDEEQLAQIEKENKLKKKEEDKKRKDAERKARKEATLAARKRRPKGQSRKKRSNRGYYSSDDASAGEDVGLSDHSNGQISPILRSGAAIELQPDTLDQVLHDTLNSMRFEPSSAPSQRRGRPPVKSRAAVKRMLEVTSHQQQAATNLPSPSQDDHISETLKPKRAKITARHRPSQGSSGNKTKTNKSKTDGTDSAQAISIPEHLPVVKISPHMQDERQSPLLESLLTKNKAGDSKLSDSEKQKNSSSSIKQASSLPPPGTFSFPPALLAANPSLANAAPGSIVVVASPGSVPNSDDQSGGGTHSANQQLLHVFMVSDDTTASGSQTGVDGGSTNNSSCTVSSQTSTSTCVASAINGKTTTSSNRKRLRSESDRYEVKASLIGSILVVISPDKRQNCIILTL